MHWSSTHTLTRTQTRTLTPTLVCCHIWHIWVWLLCIHVTSIDRYWCGACMIFIISIWMSKRKRTRAIKVMTFLHGTISSFDHVALTRINARYASMPWYWVLCNYRCMSIFGVPFDGVTINPLCTRCYQPCMCHMCSACNYFVVVWLSSCTWIGYDIYMFIYVTGDALPRGRIYIGASLAWKVHHHWPSPHLVAPSIWWFAWFLFDSIWWS